MTFGRRQSMQAQQASVLVASTSSGTAERNDAEYGAEASEVQVEIDDTI
jgi:hypothetical protein